MPKLEDIFSQLNGAKYFSTLDLQAGYHLITLDEAFIPKTSFTSPFGKYEYIQVPFGLTQAPAYFQELMTRILKDFNFAIAYLDNIIFSRTTEEQLDHIKQVFEKLRSTHLSMKLSKCHFFTKEIQYPGHILSTKGIRPLPSKTLAIKNMHPPKTSKQVCAFLGLVGYYRKFIRNFAKIAKPLTLLTHHPAKFEWTTTHHNAFLTLKESVIQAPILYYPNPTKCCIVYTHASDDTCGAELSQEHDGTEFPIAFLSHTFTGTQWKWSTTEQEAYGVYYAVMKWNYYLHGAEVIVCNDHKPMVRFPNRKKSNNKVHRWRLQLATYNITFKWISGAQNKAADCLSWLIELPQDRPGTIQMLYATNHDGPAFNTRSRTAQCTSTEDPTSQPQADAVTPDVTDTPSSTPKLLTTDRLQALLWMQKTDPFSKHISKWLSNGKAPKHEADLFLYAKGLLYKYVTDSNQKFLALVIPKAWNTQCW